MKLFEQARFYAQYHKHPILLYTHLIGLPLLMFSVMLLAGFFHLSVPNVFDVTLACLGTIVLWGYYLWLNWFLGLLLLPILAVLLWISSLISYSGPTPGALWTFIICFILSIAFLFGGHVAEGKKATPADGLWQIVMAPLYLAAEISFMFGWMQDLQKKLHGKKEP